MPQRDLSSDLKRILKQLRLGRLLPVLPERLRQARERQMDPEDVLLLVLSDEVQRRRRQRLTNRAKTAGLAPALVFDEWDGSAKITYDRRLLDEIRRLRFVELHHHALLIGPVGVGKTMLAHALGHLAVQHELSVHWESADKLFLRLKASRLDGTHALELRRLVAVDLLIIDDFALRSLDTMETTDLYELVTARHRVGSMIMTSNRSADFAQPLLDHLEVQDALAVPDVAAVDDLAGLGQQAHPGWVPRVGGKLVASRSLRLPDRDRQVDEPLDEGARLHAEAAEVLLEDVLDQHHRGDLSAGHDPIPRGVPDVDLSGCLASTTSSGRRQLFLPVVAARLIPPLLRPLPPRRRGCGRCGQPHRLSKGRWATASVVHGPGTVHSPSVMGGPSSRLGLTEVHRPAGRRGTVRAHLPRRDHQHRPGRTQRHRQVHDRPEHRPPRRPEGPHRLRRQRQHHAQRTRRPGRSPRTPARPAPLRTPPAPRHRGGRISLLRQRHADLLFEVVTRRAEAGRPIIVTTNKPFTDWSDVFPNATCVVTIVDRLVHRSEIITIEGESYRLKEARDQAAARASRRREARPTATPGTGG